MSYLKSLFQLFQVNKKNWRPVVLCLIAATIFWFLNALNKNYTTNINLPVSFTYDPKYYIPVKPLPRELRVNVTGMGWDLFRRSARLRSEPLVIPLDRPAAVKKIVGATLPALFSSQMESLKINFVVNDTVYLDIQPLGRRWLSLKLDSVDRYVQNGYGVSGSVTVQPDSILIEGPIDLITQLKEPYPVELDEADIDDEFQEDIEIRFPSNNLITKNPGQVKVKFPVERMVTVRDSVPLKLVNIPKNAEPKLQMEKLPVTLTMPEGLAGTFRWDSLHAEIDLATFGKGKIKLRPTLTGIPAYVTITKLDSLEITY